MIEWERGREGKGEWDGNGLSGLGEVGEHKNGVAKLNREKARNDRIRKGRDRSGEGRENGTGMG